jgi:DNA-binding NarL/FixJ family response regulator
MGGAMREESSKATVSGKEKDQLPHVLLIEDCAADAEIVRRTLKETRIGVVEVAQTAEEGLIMFRQAKWDLVLVDYKLPGVSGLDALVRLRERDPSVPVVMLTGMGDEQVAAGAIRRGADEYLSKDALTATLPTTARMLLETKSHDYRMISILKENQREEELRKLIEAERRLLRSLPLHSVTFGSEEPPATQHALVSTLAQLYHAVAAYSGGLPSAELGDLCRTVEGHRLSSRQLLELHIQAADQVLRDEDLAPNDLASRLNEGLLLALLWLNDRWRHTR